MLNLIKVDPELFSNADMYLLLENDMRGGISYISKRHSKGSNKFLKYYYPKQELKRIIYMVRRYPNFFQQADLNK